MKTFYIVVPECGIGNKYTLEEAEDVAEEFLSEYGENAYIFKAVSLCKKKNPPVEWEDLDS